jgi:hypothetical protein
MATPKISTFVIALIWVSFFAAVFGGFIADTMINYHVTYDESQVKRYNQLDSIYLEVQSYKNSTSDFKENTGIFDVIGGYFSNGYKTMKVAMGSLDLFMGMTNDALDTPALNIPAMQYLKTSIVLTVLVFFVIGIMLSAILKKDV